MPEIHHPCKSPTHISCKTCSHRHSDIGKLQFIDILARFHTSASIISDSGNRLPLFNPFAAAFATLGPAERYEAEFMGASEFLNRRLNEEF